MRVAKACIALCVVLGFLAFGAASALRAMGASGVEQAERTPIVYTVEVDGIIHPIATAHIRRAIAQADAAQADLLVIVLRTPGGLVDSTRDINTAIIQSKTPVAVFVSPSGSRAASAGFLITIAADVAGYARTLAAQRKRNVALVEQAVTESRTFTEHEAASASPPLIDLIAADLPDLLKQLDGRTILRFDGTSQTLRTPGAERRTVEMTWAQRVLSAVAHPQIAYLLLMLGTLGLTVEMWNPGSILPGVVGGICLLLAFFAFQVLPVSYAGVLLILFGLVLLILEVKVTSFGLLAVGGILSLFFGSILLMDSPLPELQVGLRLIVPVTLTLSAIVVFLVQLAVKAQRNQPITGEAGMLHSVGQALTSIDPGGTGRVRTRGEIWTATAAEPITAGDMVRVVGLEGLQLTVRSDRMQPAIPLAGEDAAGK